MFAFEYKCTDPTKGQGPARRDDDFFKFEFVGDAVDSDESVRDFFKAFPKVKYFKYGGEFSFLKDLDHVEFGDVRF